MQLTSQVLLPVPPQVTVPFAPGAAQAAQPMAVQPEATLLFITHEVGALAGQPWVPAPQAVMLQTVPLQAAVPPTPVGQAVQPIAVHPEATLLLATQALPHRW